MERAAAATRWTVLLLVLAALGAAGCGDRRSVKTGDGPAGGTFASRGSRDGGTLPGGDLSAPPPLREERVSPPGGGDAPPRLSSGPGDGGGTPDLPPKDPGESVTAEAPSSWDDILFDYDRYAIRDDARPTLEKVAERLRRDRSARLLIEGHCDERGTAEYNTALGERRAESARRYLVSLGVDGAALSTLSLGEERPRDGGHDEAAWRLNRRARFAIRQPSHESFALPSPSASSRQ